MNVEREGRGERDSTGYTDVSWHIWSVIVHVLAYSMQATVPGSKNTKKNNEIIDSPATKGFTVRFQDGRSGPQVGLWKWTPESLRLVVNSRAAAKMAATFWDPVTCGWERPLAGAWARTPSRVPPFASCEWVLCFVLMHFSSSNHWILPLSDKDFTRQSLSKEWPFLSGLRCLRGLRALDSIRLVWVNDKIFLFLFYTTPLEN